jgi:hypothetical protein
MPIRFRPAPGVLALGLAVGVLASCTGAEVAPGPQCDFREYNRQVAKAEQQGPVMVPQTPGSISDIPLNAVNVTDSAISNKVLVQSTNGKRLEGGQVQATARLVNCTDFALQVEGRTHFLTDTQADAEPPTAWKRIMLPARSIGTYRTTSTRRDAVDTYYIELREGS